MREQSDSMEQCSTAHPDKDTEGEYVEKGGGCNTTHSAQAQNTIDTYAEAISSEAKRTKGAFARSHLIEKRRDLDEEIDEAIEQTEIETVGLDHKCDGDNEVCVKNMMEELAGFASNTIVWILLTELNAIGFGPEDRKIIRKRWTDIAGKNARAWLLKKADESKWHKIVKMLIVSNEVRANDEMTLGRLAMLARMGENLTNKLEKCDPWLQREVCCDIPDGLLGSEPQEWLRWVLAVRCGRLGGDLTMTKKQAKEALKHWKWPKVRPPLHFVGLGAGKMAPIQSDSAWANAIIQEESQFFIIEQIDNPMEWLNEARRDEETNKEKNKRSIEKIAKEWMNEHKSRMTNSKTMIERWKDQWKQCPDLIGDGEIPEPVLEEIVIDNTRLMMWRFNVTGPETLIAACHIKKVLPESLSGKVASGTLQLWVNFHADVKWGDITWDEEKIRKINTKEDEKGDGKNKWDRKNRVLKDIESQTKIQR